MNNEKIIYDVLTTFYDLSLSSDSSRQLIASELSKKLEDESYKIEKNSIARKPVSAGIFEQHFAEIDKTNESIRENVQAQIVRRKTEKENELQSKNVKKPTKQMTKRIKPKSLKELKKPKPDFI